MLVECKCYDQLRRRWMRAWDGLDEKERAMNVMKGYVEVNDEVERDAMQYLGQMWIERQRNERNHVDVVLLSWKQKQMCPVTKGL